MAEQVTDAATAVAEPDASTPVGEVPDRLRGALLRYRVLAYTVGVGLVVLVCVGVPLQLFGHNGDVAMVVGIAHGYLYMAYAVLVFDLARRARWTITRTIAVIAAGTVPFLSFYAERRVTGWVRTER